MGLGLVPTDKPADIAHCLLRGWDIVQKQVAQLRTIARRKRRWRFKGAIRQRNGDPTYLLAYVRLLRECAEEGVAS
jgi:hypothetical protein